MLGGGSAEEVGGLEDKSGGGHLHTHTRNRGEEEGGGGGEMMGREEG